MAKIYKYQKTTDTFTTYTIIEPDYEEENEQVTELCTIDGTTYISVPESLKLPEQPEQIFLEAVTLTAEVQEKLKRASTHIGLINQRVQEKIRTQYSLEDELQILRRRNEDVVKFSGYDVFIKECCIWGDDEKTKLGLGSSDLEKQGIWR